MLELSRMTSTLTRIESVFFSPDPRVAMISRRVCCWPGAAVAALLVVAAGPIYAVAFVVAMVGGLLMLRDLRWGLVALFAVIGCCRLRRCRSRSVSRRLFSTSCC